jgi:hypothetical protein
MLNKRNRKRCRAEGCRVRTRSLYSVVVAPGLVVRVHLCDEHHQVEREHGSQAVTLKPVVSPELALAKMLQEIFT